MINKYFLAKMNIPAYLKKFLYRNSESEYEELPDGYTRVEYIESTGTQYIDTGYYANVKTRVILEFSYTQNNGDSFSNGFVFGSSNEGSGRPGISIGIDKNDSIAYRNSDTEDIFISPFVVNKNVKYRIETYKNDIKINNTIYTSSMRLLTQTLRYSSYLFARHQKKLNNIGYAYSILKGKIYFCQLYEDDILVRNFIPCKNSNNKVGLYDLVENKFYSNSGTGDFVAGEEINVKKDVTKNIGGQKNG